MFLLSSDGVFKLCSFYPLIESVSPSDGVCKLCSFLRSAVAGRIYKLCANYTSNSGFGSAVALW